MAYQFGMAEPQKARMEAGAKGVARVVFDRLPAKRQPLRAD